MSFLGDAVLAMMSAGVVALAGVVTAFFVVRRRLRRRWARLHARAALRGGRGFLSAWATGLDRIGGASFGGAMARARRRMWTAIEDADAAVEHASSRNAPVAELPSVCRTLRRVGRDLDQLLALEQRIPGRHRGPDDIRVQVTVVIGAAADVQSAALRSCRDATEPHVRAVVRETRQEVEIVSAALSRLRSFTSP